MQQLGIPSDGPDYLIGKAAVLLGPGVLLENPAETERCKAKMRLLPT